MVDLKELCKDCPKFLVQKEFALKHCDSVFDAVFDVTYFQENCSKTCEKVKRVLEEATDA